jgi:CubicO group peptidase (beta-lactamase class C family)
MESQKSPPGRFTPQVFEIDISAPASVVWSAMLDDATYRDWTTAFADGAYYEGGWALGDTIRFLGPDGPDGPDGQGGLFGTIVACVPNEYVSVEYLGQILNGVDDTTSEVARSFAGSHESYSFSEVDGVTTVRVELETVPEFAEMFAGMWPRALARLAEIAQGVGASES